MPGAPLRLPLLTFGLLTLAACTAAVSSLDDYEQMEGAAGDGDGDGDGDGAMLDAGMDGAMAMDAGGDAAGGDAGEPSDAAVDPQADLKCSSPRTLCVRLDDYSGPHDGELVQVDLVAGDVLRARAIIEPYPAADVEPVDILMPLSIAEDDVPDEGEPHPLRLQIYADNDRNGVYSDGDHDWRVALDREAKLIFDHNSNFESLDDLREFGDFTLRTTGVAKIHAGQIVEAKVIEEATGKTVGLWRTYTTPEGDFTIRIPGIIAEPEQDYVVEIWADADGDGNYDERPMDHSWSFPVTSNTSSEVDADFDHDGSPAVTALDYQFDFDE
ncbi:MAG: hypothetical protein PVI30_14410 [Myxococcales bacterium]|jgi:hypothetical protein